MNSHQRLILIATFVSIFCNNIFAIKILVYDVDSLKLELKNAKADTNIINLKLLISDAYRRNDWEKSYQYLDEAYVSAKKINYIKGIGDYYFLKGKNVGTLGDMQNALIYFDSSIYYYGKVHAEANRLNAYVYKGLCQLSIQNNINAYETYHQGLIQVDKKLYPEIYLNLLEGKANTFNQMGFLEKAVEVYREIIEFAERIGRKDLVMLQNANVGQTLAGMGQYSDGLKLLMESLNYFEEIENSRQILAILSNIGFIHGNLGNKKETIQAYQRALNLVNSEIDFYAFVQLKKSAGQAFLQFGLRDSAIQEISTLINDYRQMGDSIGVAKIYHIIGDFYKEDKVYQKAVEQYQLARKILGNNQSIEFESHLLLSLGEAYFHKYEIQNAYKIFHKAEILALESAQIPTLLKVYDYLHQIYIQKNDYKRALHYYKLKNEISDSLDFANQKSQIDSLLFAHQVASKDFEINQLQLDKQLIDLALLKKQSETKMVILVGLLLLLIGVSITFSVFQKRKNKHQKRELELNLRVLRSQMNPHFIFNALSSIHSFILSKNVKDSGEYLIKYAKLMRLFLTNSRNDFSDLASEIEILKHYCDLEQARLKNSFDYKIQYDENIDLQNITIPSLIIQPFVENSIWHGISGLKDKRGLVEIIFEVKNNLIEISIQDNGLGRQTLQSVPQNTIMDKKESFGVHLIKDRLKFISEKFKSQTSLIFIDLEEGLLVKLSVPFQSDFISEK
jgi:tetratricopeptide (TPR) repeat protein